MNTRLCMKKYKQSWGFLWSSHDQIDYIQLNSRLYMHPRFTHPKFPHYKWAKERYFENRKGDK